MIEKIKWLVQNIGFSTTSLDLTENTLQRLGFPYQTFGISRLINYVINLENILTETDEHYIIRGGTSLLSMINKIENLNEVNPNLSEKQLQNSDKTIARLKQGIFYPFVRKAPSFRAGLSGRQAISLTINIEERKVIDKNTHKVYY